MGVVELVEGFRIVLVTSRGVPLSSLDSNLECLTFILPFLSEERVCFCFNELEGRFLMIPCLLAGAAVVSTVMFVEASALFWVPLAQLVEA